MPYVGYPLNITQSIKFLIVLKEQTATWDRGVAQGWRICHLRRRERQGLKLELDLIQVERETLINGEVEMAVMKYNANIVYYCLHRPVKAKSEQVRDLISAAQNPEPDKKVCTGKPKTV